jgi:hypothetical protein
MGEHKTTHLIEFDCHHTRVFPNPAPKMGDQLWCPKCNKVATVISAPDEWRTRCVNCTYNRSHGAAKLNAEIAAAKHRMRHPEHVVRIYNGNVITQTFGNRNQIVIPMSSDSDPSIPF